MSDRRAYILEHFLQAPPAGGPPAVPPWLQIGSAVATIILGFFTIRFGSATAKKTRLETLKLERELAGDGAADEETAQGRIRPPMDVKIQGYIIRFIIMSLAQLFWNVFTNGFSLLVAGGINGFAAFSGSPLTSRIANIAGIVPATAAWFVTVLIFLTIGLPLLKDILDDLNVPFRVMWLFDLRRDKVGEGN